MTAVFVRLLFSAWSNDDGKSRPRRTPDPRVDDEPRIVSSDPSRFTSESTASESAAHNSQPDAADLALVARIRSGDEAAFRTLLDTNYEDVVSIAYRYVRVLDVARDLAQDVFVQVWMRRATFGAETSTTSLAHYLRRAVRHAALNVLRRERTRQRLELGIGEGLREADKPSDSPLSVLEREELHAQVRAVFNALTPRLREIAALYFERGLTPGEIAGVLRVAPSTVYTQLQKVFRAVATALAQGHIDR